MVKVGTVRNDLYSLHATDKIITVGGMESRKIWLFTAKSVNIQQFVPIERIVERVAKAVNIDWKAPQR